jgi:tetratricopeptide (TPR) repeat protein
MTANLLATGWRFHQAGDLPRAEQAYRQLVQQEPDNAQAWYLLGALYQALGDLATAAASLEQTLRLKPDHADALNHRGVVFIKQHRFAEALASFRKALRLKPNDVEIQTNLAVVLTHHGHLTEAATLVQAVLQRQPNYTRAQTLLRQVLVQQAADEGLAYLNEGKLAEAADRFQNCLRLRPDFPEAFNNLGQALAGQGKLREALACFQQALSLRADFAEAHTNLGLAFRQQKRLAEAEASCRAAVQLRPDMAEAHNNLGVTLQEQERLTEAVESLQRAVQLDPGYAEAHSNLGGALWCLGRLDEAVSSLRKAIRLQPQFAEAFNNLGNVFRDQGRFDDARAAYAKAEQIKPDYADVRRNAGLLALLLGDFEKGWAGYEWRWRRPDYSFRPFTQPRWDGSPLAGRTILLYAEQGLGDAIQFVRYARLVKEQGATVIVECQKPLRRLLVGCPGIDQIVVQGDPLPPYDVLALLMSLPYHFGTRVNTVPAEIPYLFADPALVEHWRQELAALPGFKIGIAWQGSPGADKQLRSIALTEFTPLAALPGVQLISLQKGPGSEQLAEVVDQWLITDLGGRLDEQAGPFMDTAAVMKSLDLVVTADTAIGHVAGALGVPVWVALQKVPDWRWLLDREDTPWYPTMRLFRQEKRGEWGPVFERIAQAVQQRRSCEPEA